MKKIFPLVLILILGCGEDDPPGQKVDRFLKSLNPASDVSTLERLTQDGRCIFPVFAPGDTIIYFRRLLAADNEAASGIDYKDLIRPFGINLNTRELLTLSADYSYPPLNYADTTEFPVISGEPVSLGIKSPDSGTFVFETTEKGPLGKSKIYLRQNNILSQLTYGDVSCHLENFSSSGRYISALLGWDPSWILLFDLDDEKNYKIERQNDLIDYMTSFSSDDRMMIFIRSDGRYVLDGASFGDIWLLTFNQ
jgi:hypothetical protein